MTNTNSPETVFNPGRFGSILDAVSASFPFYFLTSAIVLLGAHFGQEYVPLGDDRGARNTDLVSSLAAWDGGHYVRIATEGYSYDPERMSNVAFFPAYPLLGRWIASLTGWRVDYALVIASHAFLIATFAAAALYVQLVPDGQSLRFFVLLALGLFPTTFYFRMAYTESLFIFEVILFLFGTRRGWRPCILAALIGLASASRAQGVALLAPFAWHLWHHSPTWKAFLLRGSLLFPLSCWGIAAYMVYLYLAFGNPLAFVQTQKHWYRRPDIPVAEKLALELELEPIISHYLPSSFCYERFLGGDPSPLFGLYFSNPIYFVFFSAMLVLGAVKGWLSREEVMTGAVLLLFGYFSKSYVSCMCSQARYASAVFPVYLVMGQLLRRLPAPLVGGLAGFSGFFLGIYSALFVRWYALY